MRAILIGNGPSLAGVDLAHFEGELTFACNRIHLHPSWAQGWRPSYYICGDKSLNPYYIEDMKYHLAQNYPVIVTDMEHEELGSWENYKQVRVIPRCGHGSPYDLNAPIEWHLPKYCWFGGALNMATQLAIVDHGATEMIYIGCDGHYVNDSKANHFDHDYLPPGSYPGSRPDIRNDLLTVTWKIITKELNGKNIKWERG